MPRLLAIAVTFVGLFGLFALALTRLIPLLITQLTNLIEVTPFIASEANAFLLDMLQWLNARDLLGGTTPDEFVQSLVDDLFDRARPRRVARTIMRTCPGRR